MIKTQELTAQFKNDISLEKEYDKNLKDDSFKKLVEHFNLPKEKMVKHLTSLENSAQEFDHCLNCQGLNECRNEVLGYAYLPMVSENELLFHYKACRFKEKENKNIAHLKKVTSYHMPNAVKEASWDKIDQRYTKRQETILWLNEFKNNYPNNGKGLYLHGSFGGGKSYLITAMFNELAKQGVKSTIVFWTEFLQELKSSFGTDFEIRISNIKQTPLLLIDDIGAEAITSWSRDEILCSILQYRMDEKLPTFLTSNLDLKDLEQHLSGGKDIVKANRIIERIKQLTTVIEMNNTNMRK